MSAFRYFDDLSELNHLAGKIFCVPKDIKAKDEIFRAYGIGLSAPNAYFGTNWDAFNDCLLDFNWIKELNIYIIHQDLPKLGKNDMLIYLDTLKHVMDTWDTKDFVELDGVRAQFPPHQVSVFFPRNASKIVAQYIS